MLIFLIFALFFSATVFFIILSSFIGFLQTRVPFVPTRKEDIRRLIRQLPILPSDILYDLGSGDGSVVLRVEKISGARGVGFELTWWTHLLAKIKAYGAHSTSTFKRSNFFEEDWSEATIVYAYLYPPLMSRVEQKFLVNCKPGTRAVIRDFPFPNIEPVEVIRTKKPDTTPSTYVDTKWNRFKILLKSLWPSRNIQGHEFYVYIR